MAVAGQGAGKEVEQEIQDEKLVAELYKYGGAFSLVGLEFFYKQRKDAPALRIRLEGLLRDGESYRAKDVRTEKELEDSFQPRELTVGKGTRGRRDPVILLMRRLKMNPEAYLDHLAARPPSGLGEYLTPETQFGLRMEGQRGSEPLQFGEQDRGGHAGNRQGPGGRGRAFANPPRPASTPSPQRFSPQFGPQQGHAFQPSFRPVPAAIYSPRMHMGAGQAGPFYPAEKDEEYLHVPVRGPRREGYEGFGGAPSPNFFRQPPMEDRYGRNPLEAISTRLAALEESRRIERERGTMSTELRRMQSSISPFEHPGIYAHVDEMVTMHELPDTWAGPLQVAGASGNVLIADNVKLAFLKDAIWEFTRRKCAEGGEVLTQKQIRDIEAQTLEFYGKQRVEAKKIMEKARINPNKNNK
jgi:hypothetical protein